MNSGKIIGGVILAAGVIIGLSVWLGRQNQPNQPKPVQPGDQPVNSAPVADITKTSNTQSVTSPAISTLPAATTNSQGVPATGGTLTPNANGLITDWSEKIDEALKSGAEDREVAKSLLKSFPRFPAEGQVEAIQHISNLLPDEDYPELAKLMEDEKLPEDVLDELIMDLLNRPNKIMLPELLELAKNPQHPKATEAKDFLELYLEEDYGTDWNLWRTKMEEWLKANPD